MRNIMGSKFLAASLLIVFLLGNLGRWYYTLAGDFQGVYYPLSRYFWTVGNLTNFVGVSIYPPGANLFFMMIPPVSVTAYQWGLMAVNALFIFLLARLTKQPVLLGLVVLAAGPIILFRFDLLVMLLVALAIITFRQGRYPASAMVLGLAAVTKLFPLILLPYFLLVIFSSARKRIWPFVSAFFLTIFFTVILYGLVTSQQLLAVISRTSGVFTVPVHVESVIATVLTVITAFRHPGHHGLVFKEALWGLSPVYLLSSAWLYRFISPIFMIFSYVFIVRGRTLKVGMCILIILTLLVSSQLLSPQYLIWPAILATLLEKQELEKRYWRINFILILLILALTQLIYPLNYGEMLDFYNFGINGHLFLILAIRNIILVILTLRLFKQNCPGNDLSSRSVSGQVL